MNNSKRAINYGRISTLTTLATYGEPKMLCKVVVTQLQSNRGHKLVNNYLPPVASNLRKFQGIFPRHNCKKQLRKYNINVKVTTKNAFALFSLTTGKSKVNNLIDNLHPGTVTGECLEVPLQTQRVSMGQWLLRLTVKILAFLRLTVNFFLLRLT